MVERFLQGKTKILENSNGDLIRRRVPLLVYFDISPFCSCRIGIEKLPYLSDGMARVKRILDILNAEKVNDVVFTGDIGSREDISEIIVYSKELKFETFFLIGNSIFKLASYSDCEIEYEGLGLFKRSSRDVSGRLFCGAGYISCQICLCGAVYPCFNFLTICGSLFESKLSDIWRHSSFMNHFRLMKKFNCEDCKLFV